MTLLLGMGVLTAVAMVLIWAPAYPERERHPHMRAMDALARRDRCTACRAPLDALGNCLGVCAGEEWER
ncbi:MAG TPA: hypothetical protein VFK52_00095 [Nocardioidaceae bacterium]|nr:hypothetical protein [Nocardioidaceae bacterium]